MLGDDADLVKEEHKERRRRQKKRRAQLELPREDGETDERCEQTVRGEIERRKGSQAVSVMDGKRAGRVTKEERVGRQCPDECGQAVSSPPRANGSREATSG